MNLPSNVNNNRSADNTISRYTTLLPSPLHLDNFWRVGLSEIHYTNSWFNLKEYNDVRLVNYNNDSVVHSQPSMIPPGRYTDIHRLLRFITTAAKPNANVNFLPQLDHNSSSRRVTMTYGLTKEGDFIAFRLGNELEDLLGISKGWFSQDNDIRAHLKYYPEPIANNAIAPEGVLKEDILESRRSYDLSAGIHSLMVYSDVVDYSVVGDCRAQLVRVVNIPSTSQFGDSVNIVYEKPYYLPLAQRDIASIEIDIKDDSGAAIGFQFGRVEVTLHFVRHG